MQSRGVQGRMSVFNLSNVPAQLAPAINLDMATQLAYQAPLDLLAPRAGPPGAKRSNRPVHRAGTLLDYPEAEERAWRRSSQDRKGRRREGW